MQVCLSCAWACRQQARRLCTCRMQACQADTPYPTYCFRPRGAIGLCEAGRCVVSQSCACMYTLLVPRQALQAPHHSHQASPGRLQAGTDATLLLAFRASFKNGEALLPEWNVTRNENPCTGSSSNWGDRVECTNGAVTAM